MRSSMSCPRQPNECQLRCRNGSIRRLGRVRRLAVVHVNCGSRHRQIQICTRRKSKKCSCVSSSNISHRRSRSLSAKIASTNILQAMSLPLPLLVGSFAQCPDPRRWRDRCTTTRADSILQVYEVYVQLISWAEADAAAVQHEIRRQRKHHSGG
jgi:hypothetical protein